jgi:hypothetical protein
LCVADPTDAPVNVTVEELTDSGPQQIGESMRLGPGRYAVIHSSTLRAVGSDPLLVEASGPVAVEADEVPVGTLGQVAIEGIPLAP